MTLKLIAIYEAVIAPGHVRSGMGYLLSVYRSFNRTPTGRKCVFKWHAHKGIAYLHVYKYVEV